MTQKTRGAILAGAALIILIGASVAVWQFWGNIEPELDGFLSIDDLFGPKSKSGEAAVLFCSPDQVQTDDALYAVFYDPEFRERIEKVYRESHRDGSPALFNIVRFGTANEVAFQLYWKEPLEWQIKRHGDEIDFKCPRERYFAFHEMRTKYDPE